MQNDLNSRLVVIGHEEIKRLNENLAREMEEWDIERMELRRELEEAQSKLAESDRWRRRLRRALEIANGDYDPNPTRMVIR